jgi:putative spermidine/putrescine transport system substrate-binding protein
VTVVQEGPTDYARFKSLTANGEVSWDLLDVEGDFAYRAASDHLLEPLDFSVIDKQDIDPRFVFDYGIGSFYFSFVLAYNQTAIGEHVPTGWNDLFDIERFPGKRALYKVPSPGVFELALLADGVAPESLYPLDLDSAFRKLDSIRDATVFWSYGAESQQLLASSTVSLGMFWNGRVYDLAKSDTAIRPVWNQNLAIADYLIVPKGCPNKDAVMQFIAHAVSPRSQAELANVTAYAPINVAAINDVKPEVVPYLPTTYQETQVLLDVSYWAKHAAEITERWNAWLPAQKTD